MNKLSSPISLVRLCLNLLPKRLDDGIYVEEEYSYQRNQKYEYFKDEIRGAKFFYQRSYNINNFSKIMAYKVNYRMEFLLILFDTRQKVFLESYLDKNKYPDVYSIIYCLNLITRYIKNETFIKIKINQIPERTIRFINGGPHYNRSRLKVVEYISYENGWINEMLMDGINIKCYECGGRFVNGNKKFYDEIIDNSNKIIKFNYGFCRKCIYDKLKCIRCCGDFHRGYCKICTLCCGINRDDWQHRKFDKFKEIFKSDYHGSMGNNKRFFDYFCNECVENRTYDIKKLYFDIENKFMPSDIKMKIYDILDFFNMGEYMDKFI